MGLCSTKHHEKITETIPAGGSVELDLTPLSDFIATKYKIEFSNTAEGVYHMLEMVASKKSTDLNSQIYSRIGDALKVNVNMGTVAADSALVIANDEAFSLGVSILKSIL